MNAGVARDEIGCSVLTAEPRAATLSRRRKAGHHFSVGIAGLMMIAIASATWSEAPAQTAKPVTPAPTTSLAPLSDGWEQIDERLVFLTVRLSSDEASLVAVNRAIKQTGYQQSVKNGAADSYRHGNEIMDRKGGGPKPWDEFYGRTAEKFFYHPVDPNTAYINPIPISQRPPQLDYIYRANSDEQKRAEDEAAALGGKIDKLLDRRRQLEAEQSALWCQIAFQAIASREFSLRPLYRFDLKTADTDPAAAGHLEAARAACDFVRSVNQLMADAQKGIESNQDQVFQQLPGAVAAVRKALVDRLSQQESLTLDLGNPTTKVGKVAACAKRLEDLAANILDSYRLAADGDKAGDDQRKDTFRGLLQDKLLSSAETLFTMDQCVLDLAKDWKLRPDVKSPATEPTAHIVITPSVIGGAAQPAQQSSAPRPEPSGIDSADPANAIGAPAASVSHESGDWTVLRRGGNRWAIAPLEAMAVKSDNGVISVNNVDAPGKYDFDFLAYHSVLLDSDFTASFDYRGHVRSVGVTAANGVDCGRGFMLAASADWQTLILHRSYGQLDGRAGNLRLPGYVTTTGGVPAGDGVYFVIGVVDGEKCEIRNFRLDLIPASGTGGAHDIGQGGTSFPQGSAKNGKPPDGSAATAQNPAAPPSSIFDSQPQTGVQATDTTELSGQQTDPILILPSRPKPYVLGGDFEIPAGKRLEIQAGAVIVCPSRTQITIHGELVCAGDEKDPIIFCGNQHSAAWWKGLVLDGADGSSFTGTRFMDAEVGVQVFRCKPEFKNCVFANNRIGLSVGQISGYGGGNHAATLDDCVSSFNGGDGVHVHGGSVTLNSCTVTKNGGWGIIGAYYVNLNIKGSVVSLNSGGGISLSVYDSKATAVNSVLAGNKGLDLENKSTPEWDLRGNYWGPALTNYFQGGGQKPPDVKGAMRFEEFLQEIPKDCGASIREINGQALW